MSPISFQGQVAVVTGAGRGLGRAYALGLAARGAAVVVNDIGIDGSEVSRAEAVVDEIIAAGGRAVSCRVDVMTPEGGQYLVQEALDTFGSIEVVIHNAGFLRPGLVEDLTPQDIDDVLGVHLRAAFHVVQPAWRQMKTNGYGRVVLTSSSSTFGHQANSNYAAAKAGVLGLTTALAGEGAGHGIRVNAVMPYAVSSIAKDNPLVGDDNPAIRGALDTLTSRRSPESVAPLVLYLASRECVVTGQAFSALAGRYARAFSGVTNGWISADPEPSLEAIADHMSLIGDTTSFIVPGSMLDEILSVSSRVHDLKA
ncbi:MAG: SDR family NAD(P)-dependent oxidoreductase [Acidimicrobiia bacterium]